MIPAGNYLLFGRTGVGKSSLVNTMAQASLASVDYSHACTKAIIPYAFDTPAGSYVLYDSPGFCEDDNPKTDTEYLSKIKIFLNRKKIESCDISVLFTVRLGGIRVRSEDHEVVKYLAELLLRFRLPVVLTATWADFTRSDESVRRQLDLARIKYLAMIDKALLELTDKKLCAAGFDGAYAVDNESAAWMSSWNPLRLNHEQLPTLESYESEVGHPATFLSNWISAGNCDSWALVAADKLDLLAARIENLTRYPFQQDLLLPDFLGVKRLGSSPELDQSEGAPEIDQSEGMFLALSEARAPGDDYAQEAEMERQLGAETDWKWIWSADAYRLRQLLPNKDSITLRKCLSDDELVEEYDSDYHLTQEERTLELRFERLSIHPARFLIHAEPKPHIPLDLARLLAQVKHGHVCEEDALETFSFLRDRGFRRPDPPRRPTPSFQEYEEPDSYPYDPWESNRDDGVDYGYRIDWDYSE